MSTPTKRTPAFAERGYKTIAVSSDDAERTRAMAEKMNQCSWTYPPEVDEMTETGFTPVPSVKVAPPRVGESPVQIECRLHSCNAGTDNHNRSAFFSHFSSL